MNIDFRVLDGLQFRMSKFEDEIVRLKARIAALEVGQPLPPDQLIEHAAPILHNWVEPVPVPTVAPTVVEPVELDILSGMGMSAGGRN